MQTAERDGPEQLQVGGDPCGLGPRHQGHDARDK